MKNPVASRHGYRNRLARRASSALQSQNFAPEERGIYPSQIEEKFFDLGGTFLLELLMVAKVQKELVSNLRAVKLYQYSTIRTLAGYLDRKDQKTVNSPIAPIWKNSISKIARKNQ
jgi:hypothetical protein